MEIEDVISSMPDNVVTHILDCLPLQDAVRTSILAKNWRFKWTMLSQLEFDENFYLYIIQRHAESTFGRIISRLLLNIKGAITKFYLYIDDRCFFSVLDNEDIAHWILFLSQKGVKDLTICKMNGPPLELPTHLFSCLELKHLKLLYCRFDPPASFCGFPKLLSFESGLLHFESSKFGDFITQCPLLEILNMRYRRFFHDILFKRLHQSPEMNLSILPTGKVKLVNIAKFANLKMLSILLCHVDNVTITSILEHVGCLPKLQELRLEFVKCTFTEGGAKKTLPATFSCLKSLTLFTIDLSNGIMFSCALELIRSSPNLRALEITASDWGDDQTPAICPPEVNYKTMGPLQLTSVEFKNLRGSDNEACLIKYLLACSPFLKKIVIHPLAFDVMPDESLMFAMKLLKLHRASSTAEIDLA
ncbi:F-box/FBD/LRR-repeat protein At1g13570-like [Bidens hawaiensis]|uniref:F-box/FBD/LRR-repeat protein At1g13570-like n=1 Tax=Bidens hawaiensis TaxID=980011 RepID=UPI00404AD4BF